MKEVVISTENLTKYYGKQRGAVDLNITVVPGEVFGFLGPNGAGKTTTIRMLLDFIRPTSGRANIFGLDAKEHSTEIRRRTGYLPGELSLYEKMTGAELLKYFAHLRGGVDWSYVETLAERFECDLSKRIRSLSRGNKQKVGLIQAFMNKPELLVLDEPTAGLDPLMQHEFTHLVNEIKKEGRAIFVSSHIMPEVEHICDHVGIIREGLLVAVEDIETLKERAVRRLEIHFGSSVPQDPFRNLPGVQDVLVSDGILRCTVKGSLDAVIKAASKFEVVNIISQEPSLEEIFLAYYGGEDHAA